MKELKCPKIEITEIGGNCPVQAEGFIDGKPFYFRARGRHWSMSIGGNEVVGNPEWYFDAPYHDPNPTQHEVAGELHFAAGWMEKAAAESFIYTAAVLYANTREDI